MITFKPNFFKMRISTLWVAYGCFLKKVKGLLQHMKGIQCLEVVSNPAFLQHTFFLFDSSLSLEPLGVEMIHFEPRAHINDNKNNSNVSVHLN